MAEINSFQILSRQNIEEKKADEKQNWQFVLKKLAELKKFKTEKEARNFLKENWNINKDVENLNISTCIRLSCGTGEKYFNITYEYLHDDEIDIKSFNYTLEKNIAQNRK